MEKQTEEKKDQGSVKSIIGELEDIMINNDEPATNINFMKLDE
jgi:hypothetical protein